MRMPYLNELSQSREVTEVFKGYNHQKRIGDGEFYDMQNLSPNHFPLMSSRDKRGTVVLSPSFIGGGIIGKNMLWYQVSETLQATDPKDSTRGTSITDAGLSLPAKFVSFGAYLVDFENKFWCNTVENEYGEYDYGNFDYEIDRTDGYFSAYICDEEGNPIMCDVSSTAPETEASGTLWLDITETPAVLHKYYSENKAWFQEEYFVRIAFDSIEYDENPIQVGDTIRFDSPEITWGKGTVARVYTKENTAYEVMKTGVLQDNRVYIVLKCGICNTTGFRIDQDGTAANEETVTGDIVASKRSFKIFNPIPIMDYVVEANNRLWGCRYGDDGNGNFVNEIYASKLGSFRAWEKFEGISDDSYRVSCGTDGAFTGAITYGGNPLFFKEDYLHRVYGTFPFQVTPLQVNGVQDGCGKSLAVVNNILFYKSHDGICTYNGSYPSLLSLPFGGVKYSNVIGAGTETKYYFSGSNGDTNELFVYDTTTGLLHKEDNPSIVEMCAYDSEVFAMISLAGQYEYQSGIICLSNANTISGTADSTIPWFGETGIIGLNLPEQKYVTTLDIRMRLGEGAKIAIYFEYDSSGDWEEVYETEGGNLRTFNIPLRVKRCDHMRMRMEGEGDILVYTITKTIEGGSMRCR